jgi:hypothetical protein
MEIANGRNAVQPVLERGKGRGLWQQHEQAVKTFVKMRVSFWLEKLQTKIWGGLEKLMTTTLTNYAMTTKMTCM